MGPELTSIGTVRSADDLLEAIAKNWPTSSSSSRTPAGGGKSREARTTPRPHGFNRFNGFHTREKPKPRKCFSLAVAKSVTL